MRKIGLAALTVAGLAATAAGFAQGTAADPYVWLEEVNSPRATAWVQKENARTLAAFRADPRFSTFEKEALAILQATDRVPSVAFRAGALYNFWQDAANVKGLIRRTTLASYRTASPEWETVLDLDALSKAEGKSWVYKGMTCLPPDETRCMVSLSDGGRDSVVVREFDLTQRRFVDGGFALPEGRNFLDWVDRDTLLVARDWGAGTMTASNYPFIVKRWTRGQPLGEAREVFRGEAGDVGAFPGVLRDAAGRAHAELGVRYVTTFETAYSLLGAAAPVRLDLPAKSELVGIVDGQMVVAIDQPWSRGGQKFAVDSVLSFDLDRWKADPNRAPATLVWAPAARQTRDSVGVTGGELLVSYLDNVRGRIAAYNHGGGRWTARPLALPGNATVGINSTDLGSSRALIAATDFLTPSSVYLYDGASGAIEKLKTSPVRFDASGLTIEQLSATSKDGTVVPYFVVRPKDMKNDGSTPTLLNGYGGFKSSQVPYYSGLLGKLWMARGNAYVLANIRGGGEFGPAWHEAAIGATKQKTWDDFIAVADDLVKRKITSPRRLGVMGGSQGGLLVGTAITQRPDLFHGAIVQVPLFDMLRYHLIGNGASWIGEYGDPTKPAELAWLSGYSPYQKLSKAQDRIVPFIETSAADDRVTPVHGRKAAARLAELGVPYFYYENREGGHAAAANQPEQALLAAMEYTYATQRLKD